MEREDSVAKGASSGNARGVEEKKEREACSGKKKRC